MGDRKARKRGVRTRAAPISMRAVKQVWSVATDNECAWPEGWVVEWGSVGKDDVSSDGKLRKGDVSRIFPSDKLIVIDYDHARRYRNAVGSLVHELAHLYAPELEHDSKFRKLLHKFRRRVGLSRSKRPTKYM